MAPTLARGQQPELTSGGVGGHGAGIRRGTEGPRHQASATAPGRNRQAVPDGCRNGQPGRKPNETAGGRRTVDSSSSEYPTLQQAKDGKSGEPRKKKAAAPVATVKPAAEQTATRRRTEEDCTAISIGASESVVTVIADIEREVRSMQDRKDVLLKCIEETVALAESLTGCRVEVVGSTSWGGSVPQSDLDLVLLTPTADLEGQEAVGMLMELQKAMELLKVKPWKQLQLVDAPRVPILRMVDGKGLSCDVSVDQHRAIGHRTALRSALEGRPEIRRYIQLVKYWLGRRGVPLAAEGGLPSLAWAVTALRLAEDQPSGSSVEALFLNFFSKMQRLGDHSLSVEHRPDGSADFIWKRRAAGPAWSSEWVEFLTVDDPEQTPATASAKHSPKKTKSRFVGIAPPSIPAALGVLYVAELRLAWKALREGLWDELWRTSMPEARMPLPSILDLRSRKAPLHIILKDGVVHLGRLVEVNPCPTLQNSEVLHRRDQSSELILEPCELIKESSHVTNVQMLSEDSSSRIKSQPCQWVCALPTWNTRVLQGDALDRLREVLQLLGKPHNGLQQHLPPEAPEFLGAETPPCMMVAPPVHAAATDAACGAAEEGRVRVAEVPAVFPVHESMISGPHFDPSARPVALYPARPGQVYLQAAPVTFVQAFPQGMAVRCLPVANVPGGRAAWPGHQRRYQNRQHEPREETWPKNRNGKKNQARRVEVPQQVASQRNRASGQSTSFAPPGPTRQDGFGPYQWIFPTQPRAPSDESTRASDISSDDVDDPQRVVSGMADRAPVGSAGNCASRTMPRRLAPPRALAKSQCQGRDLDISYFSPASRVGEEAEEDEMPDVQELESSLLEQQATEDTIEEESNSKDEGSAEEEEYVSVADHATYLAEGAAVSTASAAATTLPAVEMGEADAATLGADRATTATGPSAVPVAAVGAATDATAAEASISANASIRPDCGAEPAADSADDVVEGLLSRINGVVSEMLDSGRARAAETADGRAASARATDWAAICGLLEAASAKTAASTTATPNSSPAESSAVASGNRSPQSTDDGRSRNAPASEVSRQNGENDARDQENHGMEEQKAKVNSSPPLACKTAPLPPGFLGVEGAATAPGMPLPTALAQRKHAQLNQQIVSRAQLTDSWRTVLGLNLEAPRFKEVSRRKHSNKNLQARGWSGPRLEDESEFALLNAGLDQPGTAT